MRSSEFQIRSGAELVREFESSPGQHRAFCSRCGSPIFCRIDAWPELRRLRLGSLDGDPGTRAIAHVWTGSKSPWYTISDQLEHFEGAPPNRYAAAPKR